MKIKFNLIILYLLNLLYLKVNSVPIDEDFNYCEALKVGLNFYKAQRAGYIDDELEDGNEIEFPWQNKFTTEFDTYLNNHTNKIGNGYLSKGYFDAGDYLKITFPLAFSMTTLSWSFLEFEDNIKFCNLTETYLATIKWGVDWLMAAHPEPNVIYAQCGHEVDHLSWSRADQIYNNNITGPRNCSLIVNSENPSSDIAFEMVASMAAASIVFEEFDQQYSEECKKHADELWNFGITHPGILYNPMYPSNVSRDEQIWAAAWMYMLYGPEYSFYRGFFDNGKISHSDLFYNKWSHVYSWNNKMSAACIFIAKNYNIYVDEANYLINSWNTKIEKTKDGLFFIDEWGNNRYSMGGSFLEAVWNLNQNKTAKTSNTNFAITQMNIIMGNNSNHHSYVSMFGFKGSKKTLNIHHRSSHSPPNGTDLKFHNINYPKNNKFPIVGALLPGPINLDDLYFEDRTRYEMNEPALDYNSVFVGVLSSLINSNSKPVNPSSSIHLLYDSEDYHREEIPLENQIDLTNNYKTLPPIPPTLKPKNNHQSNHQDDDDDDTSKPKPPIFHDFFDLNSDNNDDNGGEDDEFSNYNNNLENNDDDNDISSSNSNDQSLHKTPNPNLIEQLFENSNSIKSLNNLSKSLQLLLIVLIFLINFINL